MVFRLIFGYGLVSLQGVVADAVGEADVVEGAVGGGEG